MSKSVYNVERFRRALLQYAGGRLAQAAARAVLVLVVVRILPVEDYGAYMLIVGTAELLLQVGSFGILPLAQRYVPQMLTTVPLATLHRFVAFLVLAQLAVLAVVAYVLGLFWPDLAPVFNLTPRQIEITHFAAWLFLVVPAFRFGTELLESMLAQGQTARAGMVFARAGAIVALVLFKEDVGLREVLLVDMIVSAISIFTIWYSVHRIISTLHTPGANGKLPIREMLQFARRMALVGPMSATSSPAAVRLVLANGLGLAESGLYAFLQSLERLVSRYLPATLLRNLIRPVLISRFVGQGRSDMLAAGTGLMQKSNLLAVIGGLVVIAVCGDQIVRVMSGNKFHGAGLTLLILYVNMIATSQRGVQEMVMQITGHTRALWITSTVSPLALLAVWAFAEHGLNAAMLIVTLGSMTSNGLANIVLQRKTDWFRMDWRGIAAIFVPGVVAASLGLLLEHWLHPFVAGGIALLLFVVFLRIGRPFSHQEMSAVERVVGKRAVRVMRGFTA